MNLESQVVNLELSQKLLTLGVKQHSLFYWHNLDSIPSVICNHWFPERSGDFFVSAFTASELLEILPDLVIDEDREKVYFFQDKYSKCHRVGYVCEANEACSPYIEVKGETESNARAKMLIHLITNKLIEV